MLIVGVSFSWTDNCTVVGVQEQGRKCCSVYSRKCMTCSGLPSCSSVESLTVNETYCCASGGCCTSIVKGVCMSRIHTDRYHALCGECTDFEILLESELYDVNITRRLYCGRNDFTCVQNIRETMILYELVPCSSNDNITDNLNSASRASVTISTCLLVFLVVLLFVNKEFF